MLLVVWKQELQSRVPICLLQSTLVHAHFHATGHVHRIVLWLLVLAHLLFCTAAAVACRRRRQV